MQGNPNPSPATRFKPGQSGNPSGRPKGTMKDYLRRKFMEMSDIEKEKFLKNVSAEMQIKLAEGNPANEVGGIPDGESIKIELVNYDNNTGAVSIPAKGVSIELSSESSEVQNSRLE